MMMEELYIQVIRNFKKICPGEFGTIKPVGYCMIGKDESNNFNPCF